MVNYLARFIYFNILKNKNTNFFQFIITFLSNSVGFGRVINNIFDILSHKNQFKLDKNEIKFINILNSEINGKERKSFISVCLKLNILTIIEANILKELEDGNKIDKIKNFLRDIIKKQEYSIKNIETIISNINKLIPTLVLTLIFVSFGLPFIIDLLNVILLKILSVDKVIVNSWRADSFIIISQINKFSILFFISLIIFVYSNIFWFKQTILYHSDEKLANILFPLKRIFVTKEKYNFFNFLFTILYFSKKSIQQVLNEYIIQINFKYWSYQEIKILNNTIKTTSYGDSNLPQSIYKLSLFKANNDIVILFNNAFASLIEYRLTNSFQSKLNFLENQEKLFNTFKKEIKNTFEYGIILFKIIIWLYVAFVIYKLLPVLSYPFSIIIDSLINTTI